MGQPITVTVRAGASPDIRFFECNRSLTSMAIEVYTSESEALTGARPPDVLARRLLDAGAVKVTIYSNVVTVEAASEAEKLPPLTVTAVPALRSSLDDVTFGVQEAGAVPPEMEIGTVAAAVPLLMATTTTVPSVPL